MEREKYYEKGLKNLNVKWFTLSRKKGDDIIKTSILMLFHGTFEHNLINHDSYDSFLFIS